MKVAIDSGEYTPTHCSECSKESRITIYFTSHVWLCLECIRDAITNHRFATWRESENAMTVACIMFAVSYLNFMASAYLESREVDTMRSLEQALIGGSLFAIAVIVGGIAFCIMLYSAVAP